MLCYFVYAIITRKKKYKKNIRNMAIYIRLHLINSYQRLHSNKKKM